MLSLISLLSISSLNKDVEIPRKPSVRYDSSPIALLVLSFLLSTIPALGIPGPKVQLVNIFNEQYFLQFALKGCTKVIILGQFSTNTHFSCCYLMVKLLVTVPFLKLFTACLSQAVRLPITSGLIVSSLITVDSGPPRDLVCDILRDLISLSIVTTSNWAIITIMFRSGLNLKLKF